MKKWFHHASENDTTVIELLMDTRENSYIESKTKFWKEAYISQIMWEGGGDKESFQKCFEIDQ